jgi:hypothetical protein
MSDGIATGAKLYIVLYDTHLDRSVLVCSRILAVAVAAPQSQGRSSNPKSKDKTLAFRRDGAAL